MYKIGIISDIHSNKDALEAVLNDMEKRGVNKIVCLGDMITKYIYPREVVDALKSSCDILVKGNCDQNVIDNKNFKFAREKLGLENIEYIDSLPLKEQLLYKNLVLNFFHATPSSLTNIFNPMQNTNYSEMLIGSNSQINFAGHTHIPHISVISPKNIQLTYEGLVYLKSNGKYLVNVGSVGDPLIKNPDFNSNNSFLIGENMNYILFTDNNGVYSAEIIKVPYKNLLVKIYFDFVRKQQKDQNGIRYYPRSPKDTNKLFESLHKMDVNDIPVPDDIDKSYNR